MLKVSKKNEEEKNNKKKLTLTKCMSRSKFS